jgi:hypothetical protein
MAMAEVEDSEPAQTIDVFATTHVGEDVAFVGPFDRGVERAARAALAVFEETGVDVIAETFDRLAHDPIGGGAVDRIAFDQG